MKSTMKKLVSIFLMIMLVSALVGCSAKKDDNKNDVSPDSAPTAGVTEGAGNDTSSGDEGEQSGDNESGNGNEAGSSGDGNGSGSDDEGDYYVPEDFDPATVEGKKLIAITVDDGPDGAGTEAFISVAKENDVALTFFVVGNKIAGNPAQLEEMLKAGCEIGNHSYSHGYFTNMDAAAVKEEIDQTNELIAQYAPGAEVSFVRAPYFAYNDVVYENVGYPLIDAALQESGTNYDATLEVLLGAKDGDIVLMHTWNTGSLQALQDAIPQLEAEGFAFVTVSQLFEARGIEALDGTVYRSVGKNILNDYEVSENLFTGENTASGDWSTWETAVELSVDAVEAMTEANAIKVDYKSTAGPCLILSSWTGGPNWIQLTPSFDTGATAVFTYEDIMEAYGEDITSVDAVYVRPYGADLTATCVDMMVKK